MTVQKLVEREILGNEVCVYGEIDNVLFLPQEVSKFTGHKDVSSMLRMVSGDNRFTAYVEGEKGKRVLITEDGLYEILFRAETERAKMFRTEIREILKTIRQHGMYVTETLFDNPDVAIKVLQKLKEERDKNKALEYKIEKQAPKVLLAEMVEDRAEDISVGTMAKLLTNKGFATGSHRLFSWLRGKELCMKNNRDINIPTQRAVNMGILRVCEAQRRVGGNLVAGTRVTPKGQAYILNKFKGE